MNALTLHNLSFSYDSAAPTLNDVSLEVPRGEMLTIVGPNGSGKSTLLKLCTRILRPGSGLVRLFGRDLSDYSRSEISRKMAVVPQDGHIGFPFTVLELILMGRAPHGRGKAFESEADLAVANQVMKMTDVEHIAHQPITNLSGGERQRVLIARALAQEPEIVLLDEPNAHLDIAHQLEIFTLMKEMNSDHGLTVIGVSHDLNLASSFSDRVAMLREGELVAIGTPDSVITSNRIREVFQAEVIVDQHPTRKAPRVTLISETQPIQDKEPGRR